MRKYCFATFGISAVACVLAVEGRADAALVAGWGMNEAAGVIADASGNGIVGMPTDIGLTYGQSSAPAGTYGAITLSPAGAAAFGTAIDFSRAGGGYFSLPAAPAINNLVAGGDPGPGAFTMMGWINVDALPSGTTYRVLATGSGGGFGFSVANVDRVRMTTFGRTDYTSIDTYAFSGNWHHLAATWDNGLLTTYVDGVVAALDSANTAYLDESVGNYAIGANFDGSESFGGKIDELKIFDVAMTQSQIVAEATTAVVPEPGGLAALAAAGLLAARRRRRR